MNQKKTTRGNVQENSSQTAYPSCKGDTTRNATRNTSVNHQQRDRPTRKENKDKKQQEKKGNGKKQNINQKKGLNQSTYASNRGGRAARRN